MTTNVSGSNLCEEDACTPSPCENGGQCSLESEVPGGYSCSCSAGYTGINCETDINECADGELCTDDEVFVYEERDKIANHF